MRCTLCAVLSAGTVVLARRPSKRSMQQRSWPLNFTARIAQEVNCLLFPFSYAAQDLPPPETIGAFSDPYVRIALVPGVDERVRQSSVKRRTTNPYYNEYFKFPVAFEQLREKMLVFHLYDYDKFSRHSAIGEVEIDLSKVDVSNSVEMWCDIQRHRKVRRVCVVLGVEVDEGRMWWRVLKGGGGSRRP